MEFDLGIWINMKWEDQQLPNPKVNFEMGGRNSLINAKKWTDEFANVIMHNQYTFESTMKFADRAFSFPRVRRYGFVQENMDMLEHFQDNLNQNLSNSQHMSNFLRVANTVKKNLNDKYHDGEFDDPAGHDPKNEDDESAGNKIWTKAQ